jgi:hypothetical protein
LQRFLRQGAHLVIVGDHGDLFGEGLADDGLAASQTIMRDHFDQSGLRGEQCGINGGDGGGEIRNGSRGLAAYFGVEPGIGMEGGAEEGGNGRFRFTNQRQISDSVETP